MLLVGELHPGKPGRAKDRLALIGRARARIEAVDLNALFQRCVCCPTPVLKYFHFDRCFPKHGSAQEVS